MANQDAQMENGEDFSQDVSADDQSFDQQNGGGDAPQERGSADTPGKDDDRKLFVGGLSWETTDKELRDYFEKFGEIDSINVKIDPTTGRSRGFAFIVFKDASSIDKVTAAGDHTLNGKKVDPRKAKARHGKIFVGGLTPELTDDEIKEHFSQYGTILEMEMPFDKQKNQRKAFCFITFDSEQVANELIKTPKQTIKDKEVDVKRATPKPDQMMMMGGRGGRGGRGARGGRGGRGGYGGWGAQGGYGYGQSYGGYGYDPYSYDYYGGGGYGSYGGYGDYSYDQGYYDGGYGGGRSGRGKGASGGGGGGGFQGKQRGAGAAGARTTQRHQPY